MARSMVGGGDRIIPGSAVADLTASWTVGAWVKRSSSGFTDPIWSRWTNTTTNRQLFFYYTTGASVNKLQIDVPFIAAILTGTTAITDTNWHHCVARRSGNTWDIFLDGVNDGTVSNATAQETGGNVELGSSSAFPASLSGSIAEEAGWSVALTDAEIAAWAKGTLACKIRPASLVGYWPLFGLESPEPDYSGLGNNGVLTFTGRADHSPSALITTTTFTPVGVITSTSEPHSHEEGAGAPPLPGSAWFLLAGGTFVTEPISALPPALSENVTAPVYEPEITFTSGLAIPGSPWYRPVQDELSSRLHIADPNPLPNPVPVPPSIGNLFALMRRDPQTPEVLRGFTERVSSVFNALIRTNQLIQTGKEAWKISVTGAAGPPGPQGPAGATGPAGPLVPFIDSSAIVKGSADPTKQLRIEVDGFTTAATRVLTPPNADITIAGLEIAQTFTAVQTFQAAASAKAAVFKSAASATQPLIQLQTAAAASLGNVGGCIYHRITDGASVNVDGTEDTLDTFTTVADSLAINGDSIEGELTISVAAHAASTDRIQGYFAGIVIFDSTALTYAAAGTIEIRYRVIRVTSTTCRARVAFFPAGSATILAFANVAYTPASTLTGLTLSGTNILKWTGIAAGAGAAAGDITVREHKMFCKPFGS